MGSSSTGTQALAICAVQAMARWLNFARAPDILRLLLYSVGNQKGSYSPTRHLSRQAASFAHRYTAAHHQLRQESFAQTSKISCTSRSIGCGAVPCQIHTMTSTAFLQGSCAIKGGRASFRQAEPAMHAWRLRICRVAMSDVLCLTWSTHYSIGRISPKGGISCKSSHRSLSYPLRGKPPWVSGRLPSSAILDTQSDRQ